MARTLNLETLPIEVLGLILLAIHNPNDLRAFLSASPVSHYVFNNSSRQFRDRILATVALNALEPEARDVALAIGRVPSAETNAFGALQWAFLDDFFAKGSSYTKTKLFGPPSTDDEIKALGSLGCRINYFVDDFAAKAWARLYDGDDALQNNNKNGLETGSPPPPPPPPRLSRTERAAFQRAFLLVELFAAVFPIYRAGMSDEFIGDQAQADLFLSRLADGPLNLERMSCVMLYYTRFFQQQTRHVEDDFVAWAEALPSVYRLTTPVRPSRRDAREGRLGKAGEDVPEDVKRMLRGHGWHFFYKLDYELHGIPLFSKERRSHDSLRSLALMTSLRSQFAYQLAHASGEKRARLIVGNDMHDLRLRGGGFFDDAAQIVRRQGQPQDGEGDQEHDQGHDQGQEKEQPQPEEGSPQNAGYSFFRPLGPDVPESQGMTTDRGLNSGLRDMAYVLWDDERIRQPEVAAKLEAMSTISAEEGDRLYNSDSGPSVQERLDTVGVFIDDFRALLRWIEGEDYMSISTRRWMAGVVLNGNRG